MTELSVRPSVVEVISKAADGDEGTMDFIVDSLLYEALCEEIDRQRPHLEADARRVMGHEAKQGLEALAKRWALSDEEERIELARRAEHLYRIVEISKTSAGEPDDPGTTFHDARDEGGKFAPKGFRGQVLNALQMFTGGGKDQDKDKAGTMRGESGKALKQIAEGDRYSRARALGGALQTKTANTMTGGASGSLGRLAQVVGEVGPEAEKVFGRGLTRMAYRYRGTERRVPDELRQAVMVGLAQHKQAINTSINGVQRARVERTSDAKRLALAGDTVAGHLSAQVPDLELAKLSLEAGQLPPSRGVLMDSTGLPVSESVGVNGDHYLPFDLKNLKRLKGGQYVRTRTSGGLTDEDIYTGLLTGARQIQVVSNSGVFTIEFDPSLRGGRRYSDKARKMVQRYAAIVEQVASGKVVAQDLSPRVTAKIRADAYERAQGNKALAEKFEQDDLEKEQFKAKFQTKDDSELWDEATEAARDEMDKMGQGDSTPRLMQRQKELFNSFKKEERENAYRVYKLDAEGYNAAQKALKQEFPFFIRDTKFEHLTDFLARRKVPQVPGQPPRKRGVKDIGYSPRGGILQGKARTSTKKTEELKQKKEEEDKAKAGSGGGVGAGAGVGGSTAAVSPEQTFNAMLSNPESMVTRHLVNDLDASLAAFKHLDASKDYTPHVDTDNEGNAFIGNSGVSYASWLVKGYGGGDMRKVANFLADPTTNPQHLEAAKGALEAVSNAVTDARYNKFKEAVEKIELLQQARKPYAKLAKTPALADPGAGPQPFPDIVEIATDIDKLMKYAENHPEATAYAKDALTKEGEEALTKEISKKVDRLSQLRNWEKADGVPILSKMPSGMSGASNYDLAVQIAQAEAVNAVHPEIEKAEHMQRGLTLARTIRVNSGLSGREVPDLPFVEALDKRAARSPRVPVVKRHGPGTPIARALAARRSHSVS